jgi:hypothetical protein
MLRLLSTASATGSETASRGAATSALATAGTSDGTGSVVSVVIERNILDVTHTATGRSEFKKTPRNNSQNDFRMPQQQDFQLVAPVRKMAIKNLEELF